MGVLRGFGPRGGVLGYAAVACAGISPVGDGGRGSTHWCGGRSGKTRTDLPPISRTRCLGTEQTFAQRRRSRRVGAGQTAEPVMMPSHGVVVAVVTAVPARRIGCATLPRPVGHPFSAEIHRSTFSPPPDHRPDQNCSIICFHGTSAH